VLLALPLALAWRLRPSAEGPAPPEAGPFRSLVPAGFVALGTLLAAAQFVPPSDALFDRTFLQLDLERLSGISFTGTTSALIPVPMPTPSYWNTNVLAALARRAAAETHPALAQLPALLGAGLVVAFTALLRRSRPALAVWIGGWVLVEGFAYVKYPGSVRHHGHVFLALFAATWIHRSAASPSTAVPSGRLRDLAFRGVLAAQAVGGVVAWSMEAVSPFSSANACASYISARRLDRLPIVGSPDHSAAPVAVLLDRPMLFPESRRRSRFVVWDSRRRSPIDEADILRAARHLGTSEASDVLLVLAGREPAAPEGTQLLARFAPGAVPDEGYVVVVVPRSR
jgi:hypothetical protein